MVPEKDSAILEQSPSLTLFLHTSPELPIVGKILSTRRYPELTEQKTYCYKVRVKLQNAPAGLRYGMRGVARISGGRVSIGYRLFKSSVLYFRGM